MNPFEFARKRAVREAPPSHDDPLANRIKNASSLEDLEKVFLEIPADQKRVSPLTHEHLGYWLRRQAIRRWIELAQGNLVNLLRALQYVRLTETGDIIHELPETDILNAASDAANSSDELKLVIQQIPKEKSKKGYSSDQLGYSARNHALQRWIALAHGDIDKLLEGLNYITLTSDGKHVLTTNESELLRAAIDSAQSPAELKRIMSHIPNEHKKVSNHTNSVAPMREVWQKKN
jgi:hypothetical protein